MAGKYLALFKAKVGITRDRLIEYYEGDYVPLIAKLLPFVECHRRHYITDERSPALFPTGSPLVETGFDVIAELVLADRSETSRMAEAMASTDIRTAIQQAESHVFETVRTVKFAVDVSSTPPELLAPRPPSYAGPPAIQTFILIRKNPSLSRQQFVDHYENNHTRIVLTHLARDGTPLFAVYVRNFPLYPDDLVMDGGFGWREAPYDCFGEIAYWTEDDAQEFAPAMAREGVAKIFEEESEIMIKGGDYCQVQVETRPIAATEL